MVFLYHAQALWPEMVEASQHLSKFRFVVACLSMGWCGVDLFFVLSGALITAILLDTKHNPHYFRNFYARRTLRIFPLYYGVLIVLFVVLPLVARLIAGSPLAQITESQYYSRLWQAQPWLWTYTHNFYQAAGLNRMPGLGHFWTLAIEEQFYLIWPLVVYWLRPRQLLVVGLMGCLTAFLLRTVLLATGTTPWAVWHLTFTRIDTLLYGALIAMAARDAGPIWQRFCSLGVGLAIALAMLPIAIVSRGEAMHPVMQTCGYSLLAMLFAWVIARQFRRNENTDSHPGWDSHWLQALGRWSYAIYIFHWPVLLVARLLYEQQGVSAAIAITLAAMVTLLLSITSWYVYERHWLRLKKRFG